MNIWNLIQLNFFRIFSKINFLTEFLDQNLILSQIPQNIVHKHWNFHTQYVFGVFDRSISLSLVSTYTGIYVGKFIQDGCLNSVKLAQKHHTLCEASRSLEKMTKIARLRFCWIGTMKLSQISGSVNYKFDLFRPEG